MEIRGEYRLPAPRETVWAMLNDPAVLRACIPGCRDLEPVGENVMATTIAIAFGVVKATFAGQIRLADIVAPESYAMLGEGKGGLAGFAKGRADVHLREDGSETVLTYRLDADLGGGIARFGGRLVETSARRLAERFFENLAAQSGGTHSADP